MGELMKPGDKFTIAGCYLMKRNPDRCWWQFWKPKQFWSSELEVFTVTATHPLIERV